MTGCLLKERGWVRPLVLSMFYGLRIVQKTLGRIQHSKETAAMIMLRKKSQLFEMVLAGLNLQTLPNTKLKGRALGLGLIRPWLALSQKPGRVTLTPMLTEKGRLYGDLTVACLAEDHFMLFGSGAMQDAHSRFFARSLPDDVTHTNQTGDWHGIGIAGPKSRELLSRITRDDVSAEALKFRDCRMTFVGGVPVILNRISFSSELGFEIYCRPQYLIKLSEAIEEAGQDLGYRWYGNRALMSMRLEKGWGAWSLEFRPDFNAVESGMDIFINWKKDFVGKDATSKFKEDGVSRKLVTVTVDSPIDVTLDEAVLKDGEAVGYITSGGYAHHVGKSMAMAYVRTEHAAPGTILDVEILGEFYPIEVQGAPLYDPDGGKMRS